MSPCRGCKDKMERIMVKLRFIGKPGGKLVKGAPGNYTQGQIVTGPADRAQYFPKIWELAEEMPELIVPEAIEVDSVFELGEIDDAVESSKEFNLLDPDRKASRSFRRKGPASTDSEEDEVAVSETSLTVEDLESSKMDELKAFIVSQGTTYKSKMRKAELLELAKSLL